MQTLPENYTYPAIVADCYAEGIWVANFPDLSGCWCEGTTREEVIDRAPQTLGLYMAYREQSGLPQPSPSDREDLLRVAVGEVIQVSVIMADFRAT